jgi:PAS domain S-box-containing protein
MISLAIFVGFIFVSLTLRVQVKKRTKALSQELLERKQAETALIDSEEKHRVLFEGIPMPVFVFDKETLDILAINTATITSYGYSRQELLAMTVADIRPKEEVETLKEAVNVAPPEVANAGNWLHQKKDGTVITVQITAYDLMFDNRLSRLALVSDVTEQIKAEEELRKSESKNRILLENIPQRIFYKDINSVYISMNRNFAEDLGMDVSDIEGKTDLDFFPQELAEKYRVDDLRVINSGETEEIEESYLLEDGQERTVLTIKTPVKDKDENIIGLFGIFSDITQRKRAADALRESEEKFSSVFFNSPDAITLTAMHDGTIVEVNDGFEKMTQYSRDEVIGKTTTEIDIWGSNIRDEFIEILKGDGKVVNFEHTIKFKDGRELNVNISAEAIEINSIPHLISITRDVTERKKYEESLRKWAHVFESAQWGIVVGNPDEKTFEAMNPAYASMHGYTVEELMQKSVGDVFAPGERLVVPMHIKAANRKGHHSFEAMHIRKDGTTFPTINNVTSVKDKNGEVLYRVVNVQDITDHVRSQEELHKSEAQYREIVENQVDLVLRWKPDGTLSFVNDACLHFFGKKREELMGRSFIPYFSIESKDHLLEKFKQLTPQNPHMTNIHSILHSDGHVSWQEWTDKAFFDSDDTMIEIQSVARDITERMLSEETMRLHSQILDQIHDSVISTDLEGIVTSWNKGAEKLYGYSAEETIGKHISLIYPSGKLKEQLENEISILKERDTHEIEIVANRKSGEDAYTQLSLSLIKDSSGEATGMIGYSRDISDRKKAERSAHLASIGELASGVAHEINNPTNTIMLSAKLLMRDNALNKEEAKELYNNIYEDTERISDIVKSLLSFARADIREKVRVSLHKIFEDAITLTRKHIQKSNIQLSMNILDDIPDVKVNLHQMEQVFINLITNAIYALNNKYPAADENKRIEIEASLRQIGTLQMIRISFYDSGPGFPPNIAEKLLDPFFTTKPANEGTGLGLSISHGIITDHGGNLEIESMEGEYTKVKIELPVWSETDV